MRPSEFALADLLAEVLDTANHGAERRRMRAERKDRALREQPRPSSGTSEEGPEDG